MSRKPRPLDERFWEKVDQSSGVGECWPWTSSYFPPSKGGGPYGRFVRSRLRSVLAHRMAFELANGGITEGAEVRHTCDNPRCCNPLHLISGTHLENMDDRDERGRTARGEGAGKAKLTAGDVIEIRTGSATYREIREKYGICDGSIHAIKTRRNWRHV